MVDKKVRPKMKKMSVSKMRMIRWIREIMREGRIWNKYVRESIRVTLDERE